MKNSDIDRHVQHLVGIATLRRLRRMVDRDKAVEAGSEMWARRLGILFVAAAVIFIAGLALVTIRKH